eukprot:7249045-Prymnesium_polylepis.1
MVLRHSLDEDSRSSATCSDNGSLSCAAALIAHAALSAFSRLSMVSDSRSCSTVPEAEACLPQGGMNALAMLTLVTRTAAAARVHPLCSRPRSRR